MKTLTLLCTLSLGLGGFAGFGRADDEKTHPHQKVTMAQLPPPVQKTIQSEARGKQIEWLAKETEGGKIVYEAEIISGDTGTVIEVSEDGKILERSSHSEKGEKHEGDGK